MPKKLFLLLPILLLLSGCTTPLIGGSEDPPLRYDKTKKIQEAQNKQQQPQASQNKTPMPKQYPNAPEMEIDVEKEYRALLQTGAGDIEIRLFADKTPVTVNNFVFLARDGFYNNTIFHRVIKGFMIQGGDPTGTGTGGPGYRFEDEPFSGEYRRGTVAMANAGPDTNGSQFFIMHEDAALPPNYVIFGEVISGMEAVDAIATAEVDTAPSGESSKPREPITVKTITITEEEAAEDEE